MIFSWLRQLAALLQQLGADWQPWPLALVGLTASLLVLICRRLWSLGGSWRVAAAALGTTLAVDALFLGAALLAPHLSGLI